jgi:hypothetical protein
LALRFDVENQVAECQVTERHIVENILSKPHLTEFYYVKLSVLFSICS